MYNQDQLGTGDSEGIDVYKLWALHLFGNVYQAILKNNVRETLYWLGMLHGIQDLGPHGGMPNPEHAALDSRKRALTRTTTVSNCHDIIPRSSCATYERLLERITLTSFATGTAMATSQNLRKKLFSDMDGTSQ